MNQPFKKWLASLPIKRQAKIKKRAKQLIAQEKKKQTKLKNRKE